MNTRKTDAFQHRSSDVDAEKCFYDHATALADVSNFGVISLTREQADAVIDLISRGAVPHVTIEY